MSSYTSWYNAGSANATKGSTAVTGTGTYWKTAGVNPGDLITFDNGDTFREIASVNSETSITLAAGSPISVSGASYGIVRNFTASSPSKTAAQVAQIVEYFQRYMSEDMQKFNGKSAYDVAKDNGFTGTEAEWLETLKAALAVDGELDEIMTEVF